MNQLKQLYTSTYGREPESVERLAANGGSNRVYYRLHGPEVPGGSVIGVVGQSADENNAFIKLTRHFTLRRLPVPHILAVASDGMRYLQTDLGDLTLYDALQKGRNAGGRYTLNERKLITRTIEALPELQFRGARGLDFSCCYPQPEFDRTGVLFDLYYFKYCFLKAVDIDFHEMKLEAAFQLMADDLTTPEPRSGTGSGAINEAFQYRDFQARNVMLQPSPDGYKPYFIDYQGGRRGPCEYDVASFLWQASARYSPSLRSELVDRYIASARHYIDINESLFRRRLPLFVVFRTLQVLGAYGFRGYYERKPHFIESIPPAIANLRQMISVAGACPYPYLADVLKRVCALPQFSPKEGDRGNTTLRVRSDGYKTATQNVYPAHAEDGPPTFSKYDGRGRLVVRVFSFSFHKGIPADTSGNGGGYVFDCRGTHNPGRYEPYKNLTGLDEPVVRFLEDDGEILRFLDSVYALADAHVARYMQRGFTDIMFSFGCTGGRHRSVYSAQHLATHLNSKFGVEVRVCHREQGINFTLPLNIDQYESASQSFSSDATR